MVSIWCILTSRIVEFFVGIGDINSSFLPKQVPIAALPPDANRPASPPSDIASPGPTPPLSPFSSASTNSDTSEEELAEIEKTEILARNADVLDAQLEERPLAKMQEELQEAEDAKEAAIEAAAEKESTPVVNGAAEAGTNGHGDDGENAAEPPARLSTPPKEKHTRKALLKNTDTELTRVQRVNTCV